MGTDRVDVFLTDLVADDPDKRVDGYMDLHDFLFAQGSLHESAPRVLERLFGILEDGDAPDADWLLILVSDLCGGPSLSVPDRASPEVEQALGELAAQHCKVLLPWLSNSDIRTKSSAALALGCLREPAPVKTMLERVVAELPGDALEYTASLALAAGTLARRANVDVRAKLKPLLDSRDETVKGAASIGLWRAGEPSVLELVERTASLGRQPMALPWFDGFFALPAAEAMVQRAADAPDESLAALERMMSARLERGERPNADPAPHRFDPDPEERRPWRALLAATVDVLVAPLTGVALPLAKDLPAATRQGLELLWKRGLWDVAVSLYAGTLDDAGLWFPKDLGRFLGLAEPGPLDAEIGGEPIWAILRRIGRNEPNTVDWSGLDRLHIAMDALTGSYALRARPTALGERPEVFLTELLTPADSAWEEQLMVWAKRLLADGRVPPYEAAVVCLTLAQILKQRDQTLAGDLDPLIVTALGAASSVSAKLLEALPASRRETLAKAATDRFRRPIGAPGEAT